jgi:uncharacterized protein (DUF302 family)
MKDILIGVLAVIVLVLGVVTLSDGQSHDQNGGDEHAHDQVATTSDLGLIHVERGQSFASTTSAIRESIESNENLTLMTEVDHQANAESVDRELVPTTLFIFGNPNAGTPLMQASASVGIDLPQKMLVTERDGAVTVYYNNPSFLAKRHSIDGQQQRLKTIAGLLETLAESGE